MWTWTIDLQTGTVSGQATGRPRRGIPQDRRPLAGLRAVRRVGRSDKLVRHDLNTGAAVEHPFGTAASPGVPGEAVFVPSTGSADGGSDDWPLLLGYVYDSVRNGSDLVILDASDFAGDPVATIKLPHRVPFGFHGNWISP